MDTLLEGIVGSFITSAGFSLCAVFFLPAPILVGIWLYRKARHPFEWFVLWLTIKPFLIMPIGIVLLFFGIVFPPLLMVPGAFFTMFLLAWYWSRLDFAHTQQYLIVLLLMDAIRWISGSFLFSLYDGGNPVLGNTLLVSNLFAVVAYFIVRGFRRRQAQIK